MTDTTHGISTSRVEVTNISPYGVWILVGEEELFLPYTEFPWFKEASVGKICKVELHHPEHLYWPSLDIDLSMNKYSNSFYFTFHKQVQGPCAVTGRIRKAFHRINSEP